MKDAARRELIEKLQERTQPEMVRVVWLDAIGGLDSVDDNDAWEPVETHTLGFLWAENGRGLTLSTEWIPDIRVYPGRQANMIPWGMVSRIEWLTTGKVDVYDVSITKRRKSAKKRR